jgi:hypothetical protein
MGKGDPMHMRQFVHILCILVAAAGLAMSQSSFTAAVRGVVTDGSGAAVAAAKVTITESDRNVPHSVVADEAGRFAVGSLPPGGYTLSVEAKGFKKYTQTKISLLVQQQATFDVALQVGDITTTVEVQSTAPMLNTTISTLGQVIENRYMTALPNIGRNPLSLLSLTPGVVGANGTISPTNTNFVANGTRNSTSDILVDGAIVNTTEQNSGATDLKWAPSVDAVQEFKMQTNFFGAEYAQSGGAIVNMVTKSGTNQVHGVGYYFMRDSNLNANSWSANRAGAAIPYYHLNQLGGVIGGPIKKNKTFFFATYEYTHSKSPSSQTATFPTMDQRNGDFTRTLFSNGQLITIYNPFDTFKDASGAVKRNPFPGNTIPKSMMDPVALKAMAFYPTPNQDPNPTTHVSNWFQQDIGENTTKPQFDIKGDHSFTDRLRFTGRYSRKNGASSPANLFGASNSALSAADPYNGPSSTKTQSATGSVSFVQNPSTIWTGTYGFIYSNYARDPFIVPYDMTQLGLPKYMKDTSTYQVFPMFSSGGYTDIGTQGYWKMDRQEGVHQFSGSMTKIIGGHNIKTGAETRHNFLDYAQPGYPAGHFNFGAQTTSQDLNTGSSVQGNGFASMLLGFGNGSNFHIDPKAFSRAGYWGFFVQDDWKITRKLTINLGLRYEFEIPRTEVLNRYSYWDLGAKSPITVPGYDLRGVMKFVDGNTPSPFNSDRNNFAPRLGFAYALDNKTAIRAGAGIFYMLSRATVSGHTGAAFNTDASVPWTLDSYATRNATLSNPYPQGILTPPGNSLGDATFIGLGVGTITRANRNPEMYSWNLSIQREVGWNSMIEINYTGSRGVHLYTPYTSLSPLNPKYWLGSGALYTRNQLQAAVPNPFYGIITEPKATNLNGRTIQQYRLFRNMPQYDGVSGAEPNASDSIYHALQMKLEKRFSKGLALMAHYTWSKMIDDASVTSGNLTWLGGSTSFQNPLNYALERSLSQNDVPHRFVATADWQIPFGRGRSFGNQVNRIVDGVIGGWEVSGFFTLQSGYPLQVSQSGGTLWNGTQRPNLIGDPATTGSIYDRFTNYFNQSSFSRPAPDTFGTAARTLGIRGPSINALDAALIKSWKTFEGQRFEFRLEASNARNHPIFSDPPTSYGASNFGVIGGTKIGSRSVQLGFKYYF